METNEIEKKFQDNEIKILQERMLALEQSLKWTYNKPQILVF